MGRRRGDQLYRVLEVLGDRRSLPPRVRVAQHLFENAVSLAANAIEVGDERMIRLALKAVRRTAWALAAAKEEEKVNGADTED